jgi:hypothetical protein
MVNELPTRTCDGCGQVWSSGRFLDPDIKTDCGFCGESLPHRRSLPYVLAVELDRSSEPAAA